MRGSFVPGVAHAQLQLGQIQGVITNQDNGKPPQGVTIVVSGPALQGEQSEITDKSGSYLITQLPPGDGYIIRFYFGDVVVERPGVRISQSKTLTVSPSMPTQKGKNVYVVKERAPAVDTATANTGVEINQEILQNTAVRGRTFESAMSLAPVLPTWRRVPKPVVTLVSVCGWYGQRKRGPGRRSEHHRPGHGCRCHPASPVLHQRPEHHHGRLSGRVWPRNRRCGVHCHQDGLKRVPRRCLRFLVAVSGDADDGCPAG